MTAVISRRYLTQTKLVKKPDYEDILNVVNPDIEPSIPNRKARDHFSSHFNLSFNNISDERIKEMERQLLLQKFSKMYGFKKTATEAILEGSRLQPRSTFETPESQSPVDSEVEEGDESKGDDDGGGMKMMKKIASKASQMLNKTINAETVANFISQFIGSRKPHPTPEGNMPLFESKLSPLGKHNFLLYGSRAIRAAQKGDYTYMTEDDLLKYYDELSKYQDRYTPKRDDILTPETRRLTFEEQQQQQIIKEQKEAQEKKVPDTPIVADTGSTDDIELPDILGEKEGKEKNNNDDYDIAIKQIKAAALALQSKAITEGKKDTARKLMNKIDDITIEYGASSNRTIFEQIKKSGEFRQFIVMLKTDKFDKQEKEEYEVRLYGDYLLASEEQKKQFMKWGHVREIIEEKLKQPPEKQRAYFQGSKLGQSVNYPPTKNLPPMTVREIAEQAKKSGRSGGILGASSSSSK